MPVLPWWIQAAADPATALACGLVALLGWRIDWLGDFARLAADLGSRYVTQPIGPTWSAMGMDRPAVSLGLELTVLPALAWGSFMLYRWTERLLRNSASTEYGPPPVAATNRKTKQYRTASSP